MFGGTELAGLGITSYDSAAQIFRPAHLPYNVVRNGVETIVAKVAKNRPIPTFLTDRGDYKIQKRAKKLERFMTGLFSQLDIYNQTIPCFRDACVLGTGILSIFRRGDKIHVERIFGWEALMDIADCRYGKPQNFYTIRWIDRDVLCDMFPDFEEQISAARLNEDDVDNIVDYVGTTDRVLVKEAWHLPSGPDTDDGRHCLVMENTVLVDEGYSRHYFPFAFIRYKEPLAGFWGVGLAEELSGFQAEINETSERVQQSFYMNGSQMWLVPDGADISDVELNNGIGVIIHHKPGMAPTPINPQPLHPQTYEYLKDLPEFALKFSGISMMSSQSERPAGIIAAKALQTLDEVETERFNLVGRAWECFHMDITRQCIDLCKEIDEEYPGFKVRAPFRRYALEINWKDVDLEQDAFVLQVFPTALLAKTPAARLQQTQDLFQAGIIDRSMFLRLLDAPDINAEDDLEAAARIVADEQIEHMIDSDDPEEPGVYQSPEPFQDLVYSLHRAQAHYNLGRIQGMSEQHLELLRRYMSDAKRLLDLATPPPPPPNPGGLPGGNPDTMGQAPLIGSPTLPPPIPTVSGGPGPQGQ